MMPSPTIATTPLFFNCPTAADLSAGSTSACTLLMPSAWATTRALPWLSPVNRWLEIPSAVSHATASAAPGLRLSPKANSPRTCGCGLRSISQESVRPSASQASASLPSGSLCKPLSSSMRRLPRARSRPCKVPAMPRPVSDWLALTAGTSRRCSWQASSTALASGCSLPRCRAPASCSSCCSLPSRAWLWITRGVPEVSVPVLSKTTLVTAWARSRASASLIKMP
ncbi:hypothetical protein D9M73_160590 [compost metagenome]